MSKICGLISENPSDQLAPMFERMYEALWQSCYVRRDIGKASLERDDRFFLCNPVNAVLAEWFDCYFPDGVE